MSTRVEDATSPSGAPAVPGESAPGLLRSDRIYVSLLWLIAAGSGALATVHLGRAPLWRDEAWTYSIIDRPVAGMLRDLAHRDVNMALYYVLARVWLVFGRGDTWLRSLSVVFAVASVVAVGAVAGRVIDRRAGVVAAVLLGTNPFFIAYARDARAYSLVLLLTACSWYALVRACPTGGRAWRVSYGLCLIAIAATHAVALLIVPVQVAAVVVARRERRRSALLYGAAGLAPAVLLVVYVLINNGRQTAWIERPHASAVHEFLRSMMGPDRWIVAYAIIIGFGVAVAFRRGRPLDRLVSLTGVVAFAGPIAVLWTLSQIKPLWVDRYLIFVLPALVLLLAQAIVRAPGGVVVVVLLTIGLGAHSFRMDQPLLSRRVNVEDIRAAARQVADQGTERDALLFDPSWARPGFEHFSRALRILPRDIALAPGGRRDDMVLSRELAPAQIDARLAGVERVWVVGYGGNDWPIAPEPAAAVRAEHAGRDWVQIDQRSYGQFRVTLYAVRPSN